jgi:hypothetical protein
MQNAPAREGQGIGSRFGGDIDAHTRIRPFPQRLPQLIGLHLGRAWLSAQAIGEVA